MIKAIETEYKGYRFRSRLEARWAIFFEYLGIKFEYEPEGFELTSGRYLPDFFIPDWEIWFEVKPNKHTEQEELKAYELCEKSGYAVLISDGDPKFGMQGTAFCYALKDPGLFPDDSQGVFDGEDEADLYSKSMDILDICKYTVKPRKFRFAFSQARKYGRPIWLHFEQSQEFLLYKNMEGNLFPYKYREPLCYSTFDAEWYAGNFYGEDTFDGRINRAIKAARGARFEFGEHG